jgi:hypothetical protein
MGSNVIDIQSSNNMVTMTNQHNNQLPTPNLDLLGAYLYMFLAYQPLHILTKTLTL